MGQEVLQIPKTPPKFKAAKNCSPTVTCGVDPRSRKKKTKSSSKVARTRGKATFELLFAAFSIFGIDHESPFWATLDFGGFFGSEGPLASLCCLGMPKGSVKTHFSPRGAQLVLQTPPSKSPQILIPRFRRADWGELFFFGLAKFRKIAGEFPKDFWWRILPANFSALFSPELQAPQNVTPKIHAQNCRHSSPISRFQTGRPPNLKEQWAEGGSPTMMFCTLPPKRAQRFSYHSGVLQRQSYMGGGGSFLLTARSFLLTVGLCYLR